MNHKNQRRFFIRSIHREAGTNFFAAIHSFTPYFSTCERARPFSSLDEAATYARTELFTDDSAFEIVAE